MNYFKYFKRDGTPIEDVLEWAKEFEIMDRRVAMSTLADGKFVSTVYLGINHNFGEGEPLIFETMVFKDENDRHDLDMARYSTEAEALHGHIKMVKKWSKK